MNQDTTDLFNFLKKGDLDKYTKVFIDEAITLAILTELDEKELKELAEKAQMALGEKYKLKRLIKSHLDTLLNNNSELVGPNSQRSQPANLNQNQMMFEEGSIPSSTSLRSFVVDTSAIMFRDRMDEHFAKSKILSICMKLIRHEIRYIRTI